MGLYKITGTLHSDRPVWKSTVTPHRYLLYNGKLITFRGAEPSTSYTVKVTLILNGQAVAVSRQSVKVLVDPVTQAEQDVRNTALAAQLSAT